MGERDDATIIPAIKTRRMGRVDLSEESARELKVVLRPACSRHGYIGISIKVISKKVCRVSTTMREQRGETRSFLGNTNGVLSNCKQK